MENDDILSETHASKRIKTSTDTFPSLKSGNTIYEASSSSITSDSNAPNTTTRSITANTFIYTKTQSYLVTVAGGLEFIAEEEIREKLNATAIKRCDRGGKIFFATDRSIKEVIL